MIHYDDLLGLPWEVANCSQVCRMALDRWLYENGADRSLTDAELPGHPEDAGDALRALAAGESPWEYVGKDWRAADTVGRLVLSEGEDGHPHVSVVVNHGMVLSSSRLTGSYVTRAARVQNIRGVYELR